MSIITPISDRGVVLFAGGTAAPVTPKDRRGITVARQLLGTAAVKSGDIEGDRAKDLLVTVKAVITGGTGNLYVSFLSKRRDATNNPSVWGEAELASLWEGSADVEHNLGTGTINETFRFDGEHRLVGEIYVSVRTQNSLAAQTDYVVVAADAE
jgi:hypothetical protein